MPADGRRLHRWPACTAGARQHLAAFTAPRARRVDGVITFGILGRALARLLRYLAANPAERARWTELTGTDCGNPELVASLLLAAALRVNSAGIVLFSTIRPQPDPAGRRCCADVGSAQPARPSMPCCGSPKPNRLTAARRMGRVDYLRSRAARWSHADSRSRRGRGRSCGHRGGTGGRAPGLRRPARGKRVRDNSIQTSRTWPRLPSGIRSCTPRCRWTTRRQVGGTSVIWGGRCVPFDEVDFDRRVIHGRCSVARLLRADADLFSARLRLAGVRSRGIQDHWDATSSSLYSARIPRRGCPGVNS